MLSLLKTVFLVYLVPKGIIWAPCVGNAFRKFEHVRITNVVIAKVWF